MRISFIQQIGEDVCQLGSRKIFTSIRRSLRERKANVQLKNDVHWLRTHKKKSFITLQSKLHIVQTGSVKNSIWANI